MSSRLYSLFLAGVFLLTPATSRAVTIYNNLSEPLLGSDSVSATQWNANKLVTDGTAYSITSVILRLSSSNTSAPLEVVLFNDSANNPGTAIGTIGSTSAIGGSATDITFNPLGINLAANTTYWIVARTSGSGGYAWHLPSTLSGTGAAFNSAYSRSNNGGASWALGDSRNPPYYLQVQASDVPEPLTMMMSGLGLTLLGLWRRRSA